MYVIIICSYIFVYETRLKKFMNYKFSDNVSGLQASSIREILKFTADPEVISFAAGNPAPEAFPTEEIARISADILKNDPVLALQYSISEGYPPLRNLLKEDLEKKGCFDPDTDDLIITSGAQQANELSCKVLCNEGDTLICESPSFIGSLNAFRSYNVNLKGVEMEKGGIKLDVLEEVLKTSAGQKMIYVIPNFQNPTGDTMTLEKRKGLYELACKYDAVILEDNPYGDLRFAGQSRAWIPKAELFIPEPFQRYLLRDSGSAMYPVLRKSYRKLLSANKLQMSILLYGHRFYVTVLCQNVISMSILQDFVKFIRKNADLCLKIWINIFQRKSAIQSLRAACLSGQRFRRTAI